MLIETRAVMAETDYRTVKLAKDFRPVRRPVSTDEPRSIGERRNTIRISLRKALGH